MEKIEKHNPNCHQRLGRFTTPKSWSELPTDLLCLVMERLSFASFQRAKSVCSLWHSASKQCVPGKEIFPWLILFPKDDDNNNSCTLFNPEEKDKPHKTQDLGLGFKKSKCIATCGNWLLMRDPLRNLCIVNLFTHNTQERIDLPRPQSGIIHPVFWIDDKTKDYCVVLDVSNCHLVYSKTGDTSWTQIPETGDCHHMVFKDYKLYFLSIRGHFKILDFSTRIPQLCRDAGVHVERPRGGRSRRPMSNPLCLHRTQLVVTVTGQVLMVEIWVRLRTRAWSFQVFSVCSSGFLMTPGVVTSLGEEAMLLDQGITVLANEADGLVRNCIYFATHGKPQNELLLFNLDTRKTEPVHSFDSSSLQFSSARWFLPSFTRT